MSPEMDENRQTPEVAFDGLIGLFERTQAAMRSQASRSVDLALVVRNWLFGWYIVEFENGAAARTELYGKALLARLSGQLTQTLGRGFSKRSLEQFRSFYLAFREIAQTPSAQSMTHSKEELKKQLEEAQRAWRIRHEK